MSVNLRDLQKEVGEWSRQNFPNNKSYHPLLGVVEEVGELSHAHLKSEQGIRGTKVEHITAKIDAIGDIIIYLCDYCERNGLVLDACIGATWEEVKKRNWKKNNKDGKV